MKKNTGTLPKTILLFFFILFSVIGFMVKLPPVFRGIDKEMHSLFYFLAAAFLNILFSKGKLHYHILIFILLLLFGVGIEYAQQYSNHFFRVKIHGRFDIEDVKSNLKGLIGFSALWIIYFIGSFFVKK